MARTNADLPTLAAPTTYTSRPRRSRRTAPTAADTPACMLRSGYDLGRSVTIWERGAMIETGPSKSCGDANNPRTHTDQCLPDRHNNRACNRLLMHRCTQAISQQTNQMHPATPPLRLRTPPTPRPFKTAHQQPSTAGPAHTTTFPHPATLNLQHLSASSQQDDAKVQQNIGKHAHLPQCDWTPDALTQH